MARYGGIALFFWSVFLHAQGGQTVVVEGLARTRVQYLYEQVPELANSTDSSALARVRQQLVNLFVVGQADYEVVTGDSPDTTIIWHVNEARTRFPLFTFGGLRGNVNFLVGFKDINWRGRGNSLQVYYQYIDGEHGFQIGLDVPQLQGGRWGYFAELRRYAAPEPLYFPSGGVNYRYINEGLSAGVSYTPRPRRRYLVGATVFREDYTRLEPAAEGPAALVQRKLLFKVFRDDDRRDYHLERRAGWYHTTAAETVATEGVAGRPFWLAWHDSRHYRRVGRRGNLAGRLRLGLGTNEPTPFAPFFVDSQFNIRGIGNRIDRGTAQAVLNLEYRHTVWRERGRQRYAVQTVVFSDLGGWRAPGGRLVDIIGRDGLKHFVGGGLRLVHTHIAAATLRLDYGVEVAGGGRHGVVVGVGQYF